MSIQLPSRNFILAMLIIVLFCSVGIYYLYQILNPINSNNFSLLSAGPITSEPVSLTLNISSPDPDTLVFSPDLLIQGATLANSTVLISSDTSDATIQSSQKGNFSYTANLAEGANNFTIMVFDNAGNSKAEERTIYYSKEKLP